MRTVSVTLAGGVERGLPRGLGRFGDVAEQRADRLLGAIAAEAHVAEALRARVLRRLERRLGALLHPASRRADCASLGFGARQERGDQRTGGKTARERDERRFAQGVGHAVPRVAISFDRALACTGVASLIGGSAPVVHHSAFSVWFCLERALRVLRV